MNRRKAGVVVSIGMMIAALAGTAQAQNSSGTAAIDASLRGAVERKDVPGVVALVTDRQRVLYQGAFGVADVSTGRALTPDAHVPHRLDDQADHLAAPDAARRAGPLGSRRSGGEIPAGACEAEGVRILRRRRPARTSSARHRGRRPCGTSSPTRRGSAFLSPARSGAISSRSAGENFPFGGPLLFDPGERWHYSTSTEVVGRLVEVISGQKLEDYFRQHIFAPLKMDDTSYNIPEEKAPRVVAAQQRAGANAWTARSILQSAAAGAHHPGAGRRRRADLDRERLRPLRAHAAQRRRARRRARAQSRNGGADGPERHGRRVRVPALKSALPRSADFTFIADGRDKWGLGFLITADHVARQTLARQPELGRHQQHLFLDRSEPRHRGRDPDAVPAVRRRQGAAPSTMRSSAAPIGW